MTLGKKQTADSSKIFVFGDTERCASDIIPILKNLGYAVHHAEAAGQIGLNGVEKADPDLVLVELNTKAFAHGLDLSDRIRAQIDCPVLFLCDAGQVFELPSEKMSIPHGYLKSPVSADEVQRLVDTALYVAHLKKICRKAENACQEAETHYRLLADNLQDVIFTLDMDLNYTYVSPSIQRMRGYRAEEVIGSSFRDMATPDSVNKAQAIVTQEMELAKSGKAAPDRIRSVEAEVYCKDGSTIWTEAKFSFIRDEDNQLIGVIGINRDITDRRQIVSRLIESEEKFRTLAEACPFAIMIYQNDFWVYANPAAEAISGYSTDELYQMRFWEIVHPDYQSLVRNRGNKRQSGQNAPPAYDFKIINKSGNEIWVSLSGSSLMYQDRPAGLITVIDITERKLAEEALRESERRMTQIIEFLPDATFGINNAGQIIIWNRAIEEMTGIAAADMLGKSGYAHAIPFYEKTRPVLADHALKSDEYITSHYPGIKKIGRSLSTEAFCPGLYGGKGAYVYATASPLHDLDGHVIGAIESVRDVSERIETEHALRKSEEKYRAILENIEDGYYEVDLAGNFTFFNDFACRISGRRPEEVMGVNYQEYTDAKNAEKLFQTFNEVYKTGIPSKAFDLEIIPKTGERRNVEISVSVIKNEADEPVGFRGIIRDITERKEAEAHKARLEAQLQQAQKMEAIGTLAGGVAHDFNNILQAINGYAQLLLMKKAPDDPDYNKLTQLQKSGERAAHLVEQLLTFSRKMEGQRRHVSLNHEIELVTKLLKQTTPKMIERRIDLDEALWPVYADPVHMEQILLNLGSNAADAMPEGGTMAFETRNVFLDADYDELPGADPGPFVQLTVSDTGCGMDADTVQQIFDPFFTTKEVGKGTGLGLASVYGIVKSHGGHILCDSRVNQGTAFKIYLPAVSDPVPDTETAQQSATPEGGKETLLVVDDELPVREAATEILQHFGYQVLCAENAEQAIEIYRKKQNQVSLVILDLSMPGMGGNQCLRELLALNPSAKVIISSGYAANGLAKKALKSGALGFIGKPYQAADIAQKVRTVLDQETDLRS
ncbi:MAG TPA: PAS domain S-box protein [Desulfosalsimonadaceae bacterium]|nr:PAS domain S-box protein [Desulfosalsimonadaceae bacterium]